MRLQPLWTFTSFYCQVNLTYLIKTRWNQEILFKQVIEVHITVFYLFRGVHIIILPKVLFWLLCHVCKLAQEVRTSLFTQVSRSPWQRVSTIGKRMKTHPKFHNIHWCSGLLRSIPPRFHLVSFPVKVVS